MDILKLIKLNNEIVLIQFYKLKKRFYHTEKLSQFKCWKYHYAVQKTNNNSSI